MPDPVRLRLSRARGFDLQAVSRATNGLPATSVARPSPFSNPRRWRDCPPDAGPPAWARGVAVDLFTGDLDAGRLAFTCEEVRAELAGRNLACWCPLDGPCHADVLLTVARTIASAREALHA